MNRISTHFTWDEVTVSDTAKREGIDNSLPPSKVQNAERHVLLLEQVRLLVGPMVVSSWYRCPELNKAVGGAKTSYHMKALATDFKTPQMKLMDAFELIASSNIWFDQLIHEWTKNGANWIHIGSAEFGKAPRKEVLTAQGAILGGHMNFTRLHIG